MNHINNRARGLTPSPIVLCCMSDVIQDIADWEVLNDANRHREHCLWCNVNCDFKMVFVE